MANPPRSRNQFLSPPSMPEQELLGIDQHPAQVFDGEPQVLAGFQVLGGGGKLGGGRLAAQGYGKKTCADTRLGA